MLTNSVLFIISVQKYQQVNLNINIIFIEYN